MIAPITGATCCELADKVTGGPGAACETWRQDPAESHNQQCLRLAPLPTSSRPQAIAAHPALASAPPPPEKLSPEEFPEDIENEANSYYQKIYESEQMTIQQVQLWGSCAGQVSGA